MSKLIVDLVSRRTFSNKDSSPKRYDVSNTLLMSIFGTSEKDVSHYERKSIKVDMNISDLE